ncbi:TetR/AcrR family transcriptional regulator [Dyella telluris]|uniref:TetR/AcrR family transcriptional regulator n=1 Tax=Dyella telluris TaxID=2763498 RepID=A0A7G8Q604_9GAMM|nr:TetR/AcrR family transcriptional regulator [Dyella telluris]QNK02212.1 TetR/AcrR family transcriptional regulator [Dyella telluris]
MARKPSRRAGRPTEDNALLREVLLDAALVTFAANGVAATSVRSIATDAGVNAALMSYYFGSKADVVEAVFEERVSPVLAGFFGKLLSSEGDVRAFAAAFVSGIGQIIAAHPWYPSLWVREVLCDGGAFREMFVARTAEVAPRITQRFILAQKAGEMNPDLDATQMVVSLLGLTLVPAATMPLWQVGFGAKTAAERERHVLALLLHGLS